MRVLTGLSQLSFAVVLVIPSVTHLGVLPPLLYDRLVTRANDTSREPALHADSVRSGIDGVPVFAIFAETPRGTRLSELEPRETVTEAKGPSSSVAPQR